MYSIGSDWRRRNTMFDPSRFSIENYCTDTKKEMKHSFGDELLNNLHLLPDPLMKNLADSIITTDEKPKQRNKTMLNKETVENPVPKADQGSSRPGASPLPTLSGITSFFSGVMNVISSAMFTRRSPSPPRYYDCNEDPNVSRQGSPVGWQTASAEDQNKNVRAHDLISNTESDLVSDMSKDCLEAAAQCEDKLNRLRLLLKSKPVETPNSLRRPRKRSVSPPLEKTVIELSSAEKQSPSIQDNLTFANEINGSDLSSVENSPAIQSLERLSHASVNSQTDNKDYFDEVSGRFHSTSATESEDSFQIVFTDSPQTPPIRPRVPSDCESEDSFIVFEETPDSCYTSNDVFGEESEDDYSDSDAEVCDSGCIPVTKLAHPLSRTFGDLTDDSLYEDNPVDVVDCAVRTVCEEIPCEDIKDDSDVCETENEVKSTGLLLNEAKKLLRKNQPPKKVHFSPDPPKVRVMRVWAFAARQARAGHWERCAIDRDRFKRRIADVDMAVSWVLKPQHRSRVMFQRFMPWWNAQKRKEAAEKKLKDAEDKLRAEKAEEDRLKAEALAEERLKEEILNEERSNEDDITLKEGLREDKIHNEEKLRQETIIVEEKLIQEETIIVEAKLKQEDTSLREERIKKDNTGNKVNSNIGLINGFKETIGVDEVGSKNINKSAEKGTVNANNINTSAKEIIKKEIEEQMKVKPVKNGIVIIDSTKKNNIKGVMKKSADKIVNDGSKVVVVNGNSETKLERAKTVSDT